MQGLRDVELAGEIRDDPVDLAVLLEHPPVCEHAHGLDRVQGHTLGPLDQPGQPIVGQPAHVAGDQRTDRRVGQRSEVQAGDVAEPGPPGRAPLRKLGPRQGDHQDRCVARPLQHGLDEVEQTGVGPVQVLEDQHGRATVGHPLDVPAPRTEQLFTVAHRGRGEAQQVAQPRFHPAPLVLVGNKVRERSREPGPRGVRVVAVHDLGASANHLRERVERDAFAVRRAAALVPVHVLGQPVHVLLQLPHQAGLADPGDTGHVDEPGPWLAPGGQQQLLDQPQVLVPADERRLRRLATQGAAALGDDAHGPPRRHRVRLALERQPLDGLERDGAGGGPEGAFADEHGARLGRGLQPRRRVDQVAGHDRLVDRSEVGGGLTGDHGGAGQQRKAELAPERSHVGDDLERGADGALGVVLVRDRCAPDRHDRIADELLHQPAVALHGVGGQVEVAAEHGPDVLGVAVLGEAGEADEVDEQDRHQAPLRVRLRSRGLRRGGHQASRQRAAALAAELAGGRVGGAADLAHERQREAALRAELAA